MTDSDLGRLLGDRVLGSKILRGERTLSKDHIRKLRERFKVNAAWRRDLGRAVLACARNAAGSDLSSANRRSSV
jgi:hypothetical protein